MSYPNYPSQQGGAPYPPGPGGSSAPYPPMGGAGGAPYPPQGGAGGAPYPPMGGGGGAPYPSGPEGPYPAGGDSAGQMGFVMMPQQEDYDGGPGGAAPYLAGGDQMGFVGMPHLEDNEGGPGGAAPYPAGGADQIGFVGMPQAGGAAGSPYPPAPGGGYPSQGPQGSFAGGYPPQQGPQASFAGGYPAQQSQQPGYPGYPQQQQQQQPYQQHSMAPQQPHHGGSSPAGRYQLSVACKKLRDLDVMSKSDPVCVLYLQPAAGGQWKEVGRTEQIKNNLNPSWQTKFTVEHPGGGRQLNLKFEVYDWDSKSKQLRNHDFLARLEVTLDAILATPGHKYVQVLHSGPSKGGHFIVSAEKMGGAGAGPSHHQGMDGTVRLKFAARNLDKKDTFGKSDPYFVIYRMTGGGQITPVHKSEIIKNNLNPQWKPFSISTQQLCGGNRSARLKIDVLDYDDNGSPDLIGSFLTNLNELTQSGKRFALINPKKTSKKGYRDSGELYIQDASIY